MISDIQLLDPTFSLRKTLPRLSIAIYFQFCSVVLALQSYWNIQIVYPGLKLCNTVSLTPSLSLNIFNSEKILDFLELILQKIHCVSLLIFQNHIYQKKRF